MFPSDQLEDLVNKAIEQLGINDQIKTLGKDREETCRRLGVNPDQLLVIAGLLGGCLEVASVVIRRNQGIDIVLTGSLKKTEKSELEKAMQQVGKLPFEEVFKAFLGGINK